MEINQLRELLKLQAANEAAAKEQAARDKSQMESILKQEAQLAIQKIKDEHNVKTQSIQAFAESEVRIQMLKCTQTLADEKAARCQKDADERILYMQETNKGQACAAEMEKQIHQIRAEAPQECNKLHAEAARSKAELEKEHSQTKTELTTAKKKL